MNMVERLHIDELKRVEKQTNALLKLFRRLQKDFASLQDKYQRLENTHKEAVESYLTQLDTARSEHATALATANQKWQNRYDDEIALMKEEIHTLEVRHQLALEEKENELRAKIDALNAELKKEKELTAAMISRIRGVKA